MKIVITGTTHVGKSELFNCIAGKNLSPTGPSVDTTQGIYEIAMTEPTVGKITCYDLPGTHGLTKFELGDLVKNIRVLIGRIPFRKGTMMIKSSTTGDPIVLPGLTRRMTRWEKNRAFILLVIDLVNGFKKDDNLLMQYLRRKMPRTRILAICTKANLMPKTLVTEAIEQLRRNIPCNIPILVLWKRPSLQNRTIVLREIINAYLSRGAYLVIGSR